ncbi:MAG: hypothetical protein EBE86_034675 [Hormoscilla sp. GUM202]|nr:hypothetical protein [Hormoscilla sp. GUM202]
MKTMFLDMEWGQIYGSYKRDFIPTEIGAIVYNSENDVPILESKKLSYDIDIVIRKNIINQVGKTVGVSETVANTGRGEYQKRFDSSYILTENDLVAARKISHLSLHELGKYLHTLFNKHQVDRIILFGGHGDINIMRKARVNLSKLKIIDLQQIVKKETRHRFSLDKLSLIIGFYANRNLFGSKNFRYPLPKRYKYLIKPHKAIGDACRIFIVYKEFYGVKHEFVQQCRNYIHANNVVDES